ncbi:Phosphatase 2C family protein [Melia azedarach]|uniref:Phosphatase 2C family protein n=2 Tax=Melia azedarach TaxID=155640 RepID=A0ACC1Y2T7_MELAZ|nr:Phosphatase 2C family protein [Melia azedarach]KAJ4718041.1 Phosphatase 2C family protein [Melia azedarach]
MRRCGEQRVSKYCANELHKIIAEEWRRESGNDGWHKRWEAALCRAYGRADDALKDKSLAPYSVRTTASVVILSACQIIAANCGDSRVVLCRGKQASPLTVDHKLDREDELARIINGGGRVVDWGCLRVEGVLSMTRAIGDHDLKPWVVSVPEVTFTTRSEDDEFLILASDGLWDVLSNDDVVKLARYELRQRRKELKKDDTSSSPLCYVAEELLKIVLDALSFDNISIIIVDLKFPERRCLPRAEKRDEKQT